MSPPPAENAIITQESRRRRKSGEQRFPSQNGHLPHCFLRSNRKGGGGGGTPKLEGGTEGSGACGIFRPPADCGRWCHFCRTNNWEIISPNNCIALIDVGSACIREELLETFLQAISIARKNNPEIPFGCLTSAPKVSEKKRPSIPKTRPLPRDQ